MTLNRRVAAVRNGSQRRFAWRSRPRLSPTRPIVIAGLIFYCAAIWLAVWGASSGLLDAGIAYAQAR